MNFISKITSVGLKHFNIDPEDLPKITEVKNFENVILIFDDLERCNISINQIFAFINNLVEHNDIKAIIVTNEAEIGKMTLVKNLEQKYSVILNKNLLLKNDNQNKMYNNQQEKQDSSISKDELIKYTEKLFANDTLYEKIKEKLIGVTIYYRSDLHNIYESILKKYILDKDVRKYLLDKKGIVLDIFENKKHYNIRTLIFAIMAFEKMAIAIKKIKYEPRKYIEQQKENILKYCVTLSIHLKLGKKPYCWKDNTIKAGNISFDNKYIFGEQIFGYKFIDDYLLYRSFNYNEMKEILINLMEDNKKKDEYNASKNLLSYNVMRIWWELEDEKIEIKLKEILNELDDGKYIPIYFKEIIITLMQLKYNGFNKIVYNSYVDKMKKYFEKSHENFNKKELEALSNDKDFLDEYNKIISPLIKVLETQEKKKGKSINNCLISEDMWGEEFYKYCYQNRESIMIDRKFFFYIDVEKILEKMKTSTAKNLYGLLAGINNIYNFSNLNDYFKADISNLQKMISLLDVNKLSDKKITKKIALEKIKNKLEESLKIIQE